jgi:polyribonucleotide 5'-hydroxyl-kinase
MDSLHASRNERGTSPSSRSARSVTPQDATDWRSILLKAGQELRFHATSALHVRLAYGTAEIFGSELAPMRVYSFVGQRGSIFTFAGCELLLRDTGVDSQIEDSEAFVYLNIHMALERLREEAEDELEVWKLENTTKSLLEHYGPDVFDAASHAPTQSVSQSQIGGVAKRRRLEAASKKADKAELLDEVPPPHGPRVMVLGERDSGKSTLCKTLCSYAARSGKCPLFVDLCTNEGSVSMPCTLSATAIPRPIPPEAPQMFTSRHTYPLVPLVYFFGYQSPEMHPTVYKLLLEQLSNACRRKEWNDDGIAYSGWIIDTPHEFSQVTDGQVHDLLQNALDRLEPTVLLVIDNYALVETLKNLDLAHVKIIHVPRGGAADRSVEERRDLLEVQIKTYFYGPPMFSDKLDKPTVDLKAFSNEVKVNHVRVVRVGGEQGSEDEKCVPLETAIGTIDVPPLIHIATTPILERFILAVSSFPTLPPLSDSATEMEKKERTELLMKKVPVGQVRGFVHVSKLVEKRGVVTWLSPGQKLPHNYLIMGSLKASLM